MTLINQQYQADVSDLTPLPCDRVDDTSTVNTSTAETVVWYYSNSGTRAVAVGQVAGTMCEAKLTYSGVTNSSGSAVGCKDDTSLSFAVAARASTLVRIPEEAFSKMLDMTYAEKIVYVTTWLNTNGDYAIDHRRGQIWCLMKDTVADDSVTYKYQTALSGGGAGDKVDLIKYNGTAVGATNPIFVKEVSAGTDIAKVTATGAAAIAAATTIAAEWKLLMVTCHFSAAPTTSELFTITNNAVAGAAYDTILYSQNPSLSAATDLAFIPDGEMKFSAGDELNIAFTNTDLRTYGLSIYYQLT